MDYYLWSRAKAKRVVSFYKFFANLILIKSKNMVIGGIRIINIDLNNKIIR